MYAYAFYFLFWVHELKNVRFRVRFKTIFQLSFRTTDDKLAKV